MAKKTQTEKMTKQEFFNLGKLLHDNTLHVLLSAYKLPKEQRTVGRVKSTAAQWIGADPSSLVPVIKKLRKEYKYFTSDRDVNDERVVFLSLTEKGEYFIQWVLANCDVQFPDEVFNPPLLQPTPEPPLTSDPETPATN